MMVQKQEVLIKMVYTGFHIIQHLLQLIDEGKIEESQNLFENINQRYPQDLDMKRLYSDFRSYLMYGELEELDNIKKDLDILRVIRKIRTQDIYPIQF